MALYQKDAGVKEEGFDREVHDISKEDYVDREDTGDNEDNMLINVVQLLMGEETVGRRTPLIGRRQLVGNMLIVDVREVTVNMDERVDIEEYFSHRGGFQSPRHCC